MKSSKKNKKNLIRNKKKVGFDCPPLIYFFFLPISCLIVCTL